MSRLRTVIGATLRRRRQAQARTLREVADAAGVSLTYLSEVERGRKEPSSEVLEAVCAALGLILADLLFEVAEELVHLEARNALPAIGFVPQRPGAIPASELPDRAVRARPASALARPRFEPFDPLQPLQPLQPVQPVQPLRSAQPPLLPERPREVEPVTVTGPPADTGDNGPVARVIDLYAFASRRSA
jgi:transcriptional regulator with XRE-family HTH domain